MDNLGSQATDLKNKRKSLGLTQEELAKRVGITATTISSIESGKTVASKLTINKLQKFWDSLNHVSVEIPGFEPTTEPEPNPFGTPPLTKVTNNDFSFELIDTLRNGQLLLKNRRGEFFRAERL